MSDVTLWFADVITDGRGALQVGIMALDDGRVVEQRRLDPDVALVLHAEHADALAEAQLEIEALRVERDRARDIAARLEGELARVHSAIESAIWSAEPDADFIAVRAAWRILGEVPDDPDAVIPADGAS